MKDYTWLDEILQPFHIDDCFADGVWELSKDAQHLCNCPLKESKQAIIARIKSLLDELEAKLPKEKNTKYGDGIGRNYYIRAEGFNAATHQAKSAVDDVRKSL